MELRGQDIFGGSANQAVLHRGFVVPSSSAFNEPATPAIMDVMEHSVAVKFTQSWTEAEQELHTLDFIEHLLQYGTHWISGSLRQNWRGISKSLVGHRPIA